VRLFLFYPKLPNSQLEHVSAQCRPPFKLKIIAPGSPKNVMQIFNFYTFFLIFRVGSRNGRTDGRTGKTRSAAY